MNSQELLNKLGDLLDMDKKKRKKHADELKALLKLLKSEEKKMLEKCQQETRKSKKKMINREVAVLHAKRKKGLKALKKLVDI